MMQKRIDESFWDGLGVEIEACADFPQKVGFRENFPGPGKKSRPEKKISDWMLWACFWWEGCRLVIPGTLTP